MQRGGTSLMTWASDIKSFLLAGYLNLPLALAGTLLIIGLMTANYAIIFLLFGFIGVVPVVTIVLNILFEFLRSILPASIGDLFAANRSQMCDLIIAFPSSSTSNVPSTAAVTTWMSMMTFVLSYLLFNAVELLQRKPEYPPMASDEEKKKIDQGASTRVTQAMLSIVMISILALVLYFTRIRSGCETILGSLITLGIFSSLGYSWFKMLSSVGEDRLSDIFGIANRLLSPEATSNAPVACLPMKTT